MSRPSKQDRSRETNVEAADMVADDVGVAALDAADVVVVADVVGVAAHMMHPTLPIIGMSVKRT